ncbi:hypothetical protein NN561_005403 [Cricetulus griseus]
MQSAEVALGARAMPPQPSRVAGRRGPGGRALRPGGRGQEGAALRRACGGQAAAAAWGGPGPGRASRPLVSRCVREPGGGGSGGKGTRAALSSAAPWRGRVAGPSLRRAPLRPRPRSHRAGGADAPSPGHSGHLWSPRCHPGGTPILSGVHLGGQVFQLETRKLEERLRGFESARMP